MGNWDSYKPVVRVYIGVSALENCLAVANKDTFIYSHDPVISFITSHLFLEVGRVKMSLYAS